jgi:hypothetical protein
LVATPVNNNADTPLALLILLDLADLLSRVEEIQYLTVLFLFHGQFLEDFFL